MDGYRYRRKAADLTCKNDGCVMPWRVIGLHSLTWSSPMKALQPTSFLFDLDGTLVDSVYDHVLAWNAALQEEGIDFRSGAFTGALACLAACSPSIGKRETGIEFDDDRLARLRALARQATISKHSANTRPLPGRASC